MVTAAQQRKLTLYCNEGGSDKQYTLWIEPQGSGFVVNFQYGPRGGWVRPGTKTPAPVALPKAEKVYAQLLAAKRAKGYHEGEDAPAFSDVAGAVDSGLRVMLLTAATEEELEQFITDDAWGAQEKLNGVHCALIVENTKVTGVNKKGLVMPIPEAIAEALRHLSGRIELDGELVGTTYYLFDVIRAAMPARDRIGLVESLIAQGIRLPDGLELRRSIRPVPTAIGTAAKRALVARLRETRKEGVVFKKLDSPYLPGKIPSIAKAIAVKIKFYAEGDFVVLGWTDGKQSIRIGARPSAGASCVDVGRVTAPDKYVEQIKFGAVVRVRYLYATAGKKLYQPTLNPTDDGSVVRDDMAPIDCLLSQLRFEGKDE